MANREDPEKTTPNGKFRRWTEISDGLSWYDIVHVMYSSAKLVDKDDVSGIVSHEVSKLRQKAAGLLSDSDRKYAGKKLSRKSWMAESDSDIGSDKDGNDDEEEENEEMDSVDEADNYSVSDESMGEDNDVDDDIAGFKSKINRSEDEVEFTFTDDGDYGKYGDADNDDDGDESGSGIDDDNNSDESGSGDDDDDESEGSEDDEDGIQKFSATAQDEIAKGSAAAQQLSLWDTLLEGRIKLQKAVSLINQLPQQNVWTQFSQESSNFEDESRKTQKVFKHLLGSLVHLQNVLLVQNTDTVSLVDGAEKPGSGTQSKPVVDDDDEEILSDTDEEMAAKEEPVKPQVKVEKRKISMDDYPGLLKKRYDNFHNFRDATIQRWYDKTRLAGGKVKGKSFSAFDQSALVQIKQILSDKDRLIRRTQLKRSVYRTLGKAPKMEDPEIIPSENGEPEMIETANSVEKNEYDEEIFDDDDFYHQLLRELIQKKTADINDPIASTRQWLQIQRLRNKRKRKIDPKASKDRKIKYSVHKKLINFMTPIDDCEWSHEARQISKHLQQTTFENIVVNEEIAHGMTCSNPYLERYTQMYLAEEMSLIVSNHFPVEYQ